MSESLPWEETAGHLSAYSNMLRISRYTMEERFNYIKGAISRHSQMREEVENGVRQSMFRKKEEILRAKEAKGGHIASTWFLKGEVVSTISC